MDHRQTYYRQGLLLRTTMGKPEVQNLSFSQEKQVTGTDSWALQLILHFRNLQQENGRFCRL